VSFCVCSLWPRLRVFFRVQGICSRCPPHNVVDAPSIRYGPNCLEEIGNAAKTNWGLKRVAVFTDKVVRKLEIFDVVLKSLAADGIEYVIFDDVRSNSLVIRPACMCWKNVLAG